MYIFYFHMYQFGFRKGRYCICQSPEPLNDAFASDYTRSDSEWMVPGTVDPLED